MNYQNPDELIEQVLKLRRAADCGMRESEGLTDSRIASIINVTFGTEHTKDSVRAIWRRHSEVRKTPSFSMSAVTEWKEHVPLNVKGTYMVIGDLHAPFITPGYFEFLYRTYTRYNVKHVFCIGDLVDQYALSFFDKLPEADSAVSELQKARLAIKELADMFPVMKIVAGNHDNRYLRVAVKAGIPQIYMKTLEEVLEFPEGWEMNLSYIINGNTLMEHGTSAGANATRDRAWGTSMNVIQGHTHSYGGVIFMNCGIKTRWGLNVGCGLDSTSYAAKYAVGFKNKPTLGSGVVLDAEVPLFVPFAG